MLFGWITKLRERRRAVLQSWRARLPEEKLRLFDLAEVELNACSTMLGVALDDALSFRADRRWSQAREGVAVSSALADRLADRLEAILEAVGEQGKHLVAVPEVLPLHSDFFGTAAAQSRARRSSILHETVLSIRGRFTKKLRVLNAVAEEATRHFQDKAAAIAEGAAGVDEWEALIALHSDLDTCLLETIILLKSFLHVLPPEQVGDFGKKLQDGMARPALARRRYSPVST